MKFITRVKFRRSTAALWTSNNPVLFEGEAGYETDTGKFKIGDGVTAWSGLVYSSGATGATGATGAKGDQGIQGEAGPNQVSDATETTFGNGVLISDGAGNVALIPFTGDTTKFLRDDGTMAVAGGGAVSSVFGRTGAVVAATGDYAQANITGLKTSDSPQFAALNIGHASDTTIARVSAGVISVEGATVLVQGAALGTPASGTLTNCTGLPAGGLSAAATSRIFGRKTAGAGVGEEVTLSELLDFIGSAAQGDILYRGASGWSRLAAGTNGYYLKSQGAGANLTWDVGGSGVATEDVFARVNELRGGVVFDGATSGQRCTTALVDTSIGKSDFTVAVTLKIPSSVPSSAASIVALSPASTTTSGNTLQVWIDTSGKLNVTLYGTTSGSTNTYRWISTTAVTTTYGGKFIIVAVTRSSGTGTIYINGVDYTSSGAWSSGGGGGAPASFAESISSGYVHVGGLASVAPYTDRIVSVTLWNNALSASSVLAFCNMGLLAESQWNSVTGYNAIYNIERNSAFSSTTDWVATGGGASISNAGVVALGAAGESVSLSAISGYIATLTANVLYRLTFTITGHSGNSVTAYLGTAVNGTTVNIGTFSASGTYTFEFTPTSAVTTGVFSFIANTGSSNWTISNVTIARVLVTNGNCETAGGGGGSNVANNITQGWTSVYTGTSTLSLDSATKFSGTNSIKFDRVGTSDDVAHYMATTHPTLLSPGKRYIVSFYAKGNAGGELVRVVDASSGSSYQAGITLTTGWVKYTTNSFVAIGTRIGIRQNFTGAGTWWIDDIEIVEVGSTAQWNNRGLFEYSTAWRNNNPSVADGTFTGLIQRSNGSYVNILGSQVPFSLLTTRGDLLARGANSDQRLAVGSRGKSLLSDGTDPVYTYDNLTGALENLSAIEWVVGATTSTFSVYGDAVNANGTPSASAGDANQPPMINAASGAVTGNAAGWYGLTMTIPRQQPKVVAIIRLVDTTSIRIWVSLHDGSSTSGTNADDPASRQLMGFRFSTDAGDTNWRCCTKDGTTLNNQDSGVAPSTSGVTRLMMDHTGSSIKFYINGTLVQTISSNLPSSTAACRLQIYAETRTTAAKNIKAHSAAIVRGF